MGTKNQVCAWADETLVGKIDERRIELSEEFGRIPARSEIVRAALEQYLGLPVTPFDQVSPARSIGQKKRWSRSTE